MKKLYLLLSLFGFLIPYYSFVKFLFNNWLDISLFLSFLFSNNISTFFWLDVIISALVLIVFIIYEWKKNKIKGYWYSVFWTCLMGVSFWLPFFLYLREKNK